MDSNKTHGEKARWELHKNATSYFEEILEATLHKIAAVQPLAISENIQVRQTICRTLLEKQGQILKRHFSIDPYHGRTSVGQPVRSY